MDADTVTRATGFRSVLHSGSFLVSFVTAKKGLQCVKPLTNKLQSNSKDVCSAHANITEVKTFIAELREIAKTHNFCVVFGSYPNGIKRRRGNPFAKALLASNIA